MNPDLSGQNASICGLHGSDLGDFLSDDFATLPEPIDTPPSTPPSDNAPSSGQPPTTANTSTQSIGLSDPTVSQARRRQLDAINKLHSLGAQLDIDIPEIVVIGSQSAGKSSLIESISGITLPRAGGTCTRCPTECRLIHSNEHWQCTVTLRFMPEISERHLDQVRNVPFGELITNPQDVEERLRRAQRAVLNPGINSRRFLDDDYHPELNELNFTKNCVSVDIKGSDVTDLSFCDLPGLIASVSDPGRDEDVENVTHLVSSYIARPSSIILLTVACESDFETQGAYRLAKQFDKDGTRTIGVLTKPDRIAERDEDHWLKLIKNESSPLQNGWFCVKQPSTVELEEGLTFQEARRRGEEFFRTRQPWSMLEGVYQRRLGPHALTTKLNEFLMTLISRRFPELMEELQAMLQKTKTEFQKLPAPVSTDPVLEVMHLIGDFTDDLFRHAGGFGRYASGHSSGSATAAVGNQFEPIAAAHETFRQQIRSTAPDFRPFGSPSIQPPERASTPDPFLVISPAPSQQAYCSSPGSVCPTPALPRLGERDDLPNPDFLLSEDAGQVELSESPIYLDDVVACVQKATTRELPGYYPFHVLQELITRSTEQWEAPSRSLVNAIHRTVVSHRSTLMMKYFAQYTEGGLRQTVSKILETYMQNRREECLERVRWLLELETHAFTLNKHYLDDYRSKFLEFYKDQRRRHLNFYHHHATSEPWNPNQFAIEIMATVRAYFQVAYKRIVDTIPLAIDRELVRVQKRSVQKALFVGLDITGPNAHEHCQRLLAEPAETVARREELGRRLVRLEAAQREMLDV